MRCFIKVILRALTGVSYPKLCKRPAPSRFQRENYLQSLPNFKIILKVRHNRRTITFPNIHKVVGRALDGFGGNILQFNLVDCACFNVP